MQIPYRKLGKYGQQSSDPLLTQGKFKELEKKLETLKKKKPALAKEVSRLAEMGDFSENVEYQLAKGKLRGLSNSILKIENQLRQAEIIKPKNKFIVEVGNTVVVEMDGKKKEFQILGSTESAPEKGIISHSSPIGSALLGHKVGDEFVAEIASREVNLKILKIS